MSNKFRINNGLIYTDGNQTNGYVLTSDANGNATWQDPLGQLSGTTGTTGTVQLITGQAIVNTTYVTAASKIFLTYDGNTAVFSPTTNYVVLVVSNIVANTSFTIDSLDPVSGLNEISDVNYVYWRIIN